MRLLPVLFMFTVGLSFGAGLRNTSQDRQCGIEFESLRFVATPQGPRVPLYWDQRLVNYLNQTYEATQQPGSAIAGPVVLPVYSATPQIFRRGAYIFVTTGLLAQIHDESELVNALERPSAILPGRRDTASIRSCGVLTTDQAAFAPVWERFRQMLARYEGGTHLRLKRRAADAELAPAEITDLER